MTALTRPGLVNVRETVDAATPASRATSVMVARFRERGEADIRTVWQKMANDCRGLRHTPTVPVSDTEDPPPEASDD
ncbi:hypothetical protein RDE2_38100 [Rhodococcus sp. RDE2]|nr:hypothetical protein RDE2_38100 [Rhodococcus sp. RDE2]